MHSMEKFLSEDPYSLRRSERSDININEPCEVRHCAQSLGVKEEHLMQAVDVAGLSTRAVQAHLGC